MCVLKVHIKPSIFGNIFSKIEKAVITFSILKKMFLKMEDLMYALRTHISKILLKIPKDANKLSCKVPSLLILFIYLFLILVSIIWFLYNKT